MKLQQWEMRVSIALSILTLAAGVALATALSANRDTVEREGREVSFTVASNVVIYAGSIVCENTAAKVQPAADTSGFIVVGRAEEKADNTGANYSATKAIKVRRGTFRWANGGSFTDANVGDLAYVADDQTVTTAASATYDVVAGVIIDVDSDGVWVDTYAVGGQGAASVTTLSASGAVSFGSTLGVADAITLTDGDGAATLTAKAASGAYDAVLVLDADAGEDNADTWTIESEAADNDLSFVNHTTENMKLSSAGDLTVTGDIIATGSDISAGAAGVKLTGDGDGAITFLGLGNGSDEDLTMNLDDVANTATFTSSTGMNSLNFSNMAVNITGNSAALTVTDYNGAAAIGAVAASGAYDATVTLDADAGEDNEDTWIIESEAADNDLSFVNHTTENMKLDKTGNLTVTGDITASGADLYLNTTHIYVSGTNLVVVIGSVTQKLAWAGAP